LKKCRKCKRILDFKEFYKNEKTADRFFNSCKSCWLSQCAERRKKLGLGFNKEYLDKYYEGNKDRYYQLSREWKKKNPHVIRWQVACGSKRLKTATPKWVDKDSMRVIYYKCPKDMQIDHIVPIKGKIVCGLHVPWNLQYLSPKENRTKKNKFEAEKKCI
jgi:5-methylcytosine-specific restriction endonuclease McrA